jgi:hypothetical protein
MGQDRQRRQRGRVLLVASLLFLGSGSFYEYLRRAKKERQCHCGYNLIPVLVAARDIPAGTVVLPASTRLRPR